ncbi:hypothetical protein M427DRAFT_119444 [Gonapodya prolifera JEL478]|uniref:Elongation factor 3 n=1 Tax=Gonapodya prolifera (strain JEL478) TaxID=1344416 RepID=EF3_GONPJ|nr:hypothetical protein M427DRAFT_119444 [Gonapodya prolifera JEL478]|eukprot:KXS20890.1 hypothetical protein M427DRAFT_119444 [Gonapodya prolifera JEL478]
MPPKKSNARNASLLKEAVTNAGRSDTASTAREGSIAATFVSDSDSSTTASGPVDEKVAAVAELITTLTTNAASDKRQSAADDIAKFVEAEGVAQMVKTKILHGIATGLHNTKQPVAREGAITAIETLIKSPVSKQIEPYMITFIPVLLERLSDKAKTVCLAADSALKALITRLTPYATKQVLPLLLAGIEYSQKWQTKVGALELMQSLSKTAPRQMTTAVPDLVPPLSEVMHDTKAEAKNAGRQTMEAICELINNKDIEKFIPALIDTIANPEKVPDTVHLLGATTFVSEVLPPTLAIMVPLLSRGLNERQTAIKRKAAVIIINMCKLVEKPQIIAPFLPRLLPTLEKIQDDVADPECRQVCQNATKILTKVGIPAPGTVMDDSYEFKKLDDKALAYLKKAIGHQQITEIPEAYRPVLEYLEHIAAAMVADGNMDNDDWNGSIIPTLKAFIPTEGTVTNAVKEFRELSFGSNVKEAVAEEEEDDAEELCNCEFSLAYGARVLLNRTHLILKRGHRYGLTGANGSGKSTLMRAIANGQVEGFPPADQLKTVAVEHDLDGAHEHDNKEVQAFVLEDPVYAHLPKETVVNMLESVGFKGPMATRPVGQLSGGWRMKLALARAMLHNADILLLDEPTNHLDVINVAWLQDYLIGLKTVTSIIVSHDSSFLDIVCSDIIHLDNFKLKRYRGNLSKFVEAVPEAKAYYELGAAQQTFRFPEPGMLEGVKTKERAILKVQNAVFQYPGTDRRQLNGVTFQCSLGSRVAVVGPNGAGKSTLIKLLCGVIEPDNGVVWRHPNLRIAYVAQHAFEHIEKHTNLTPNQYIQWRYQTGEDREEMEKAARQISAEEEAAMKKVQVISGEKKVVDSVIGRRKLKNSYEYEVSWVGKLSNENSWLPRDTLIEMGFLKKVQEIDQAEAARQGLARPLTQKEIEKHLSDVGIDSEIGTHSHIRGLSGGQKVKVVIAGAMWQRPHLLVLDEPTNFLDRDSLGALKTAIDAYGGGVIMVTHSREFSEAICKEVWKVDNGELTPTGHNWVSGQGSGPRLEDKNKDEEVFDAFGNKIDVAKQKSKLSGKDLRKKRKEREARRKRGEEVSDDDE